MALRPPKGSDPAARNQWRQAGLALTIPTMMAAGPLVGYFIAYMLNLWLDIPGPWDGRVKIIGVLLGTAGGIRETIKLIKKISSETKP